VQFLRTEVSGRAKSREGRRAQGGGRQAKRGVTSNREKKKKIKEEGKRNQAREPKGTNWGLLCKPTPQRQGKGKKKGP